MKLFVAAIAAICALAAQPRLQLRVGPLQRTGCLRERQKRSRQVLLRLRAILSFID